MTSPLKGLAFAPNEADVMTLAKTCWGEARGEGIAGMIAVCWVAINRAVACSRVPRRQFGTGSIVTACRAPLQFSCWNDDDPNRPLLDMLTLDNVEFQRAMYAALAVILGQTSDPTNGALFYWADSIETPDWAEGKGYVSIGRHRFLQGNA